jgi:murein DD-endopeptidase MepM/ murein hydrolase activator NlpD
MKENDALVFKSSDHPSQSEFTIGYIKLDVPPSDIQLSKSTNSVFLGALRSPADTPFKTGYSNWDITVRMQFYGEEEIASKLLPIVGMCKVAPIVNVNNLTIKEQLFGHLAGALGVSTAADDLNFLGTLNYYYSQDTTISVIIEGMSIRVMPQFGGLCLDVTLFLKYYNHYVVSPFFKVDNDKLKGRVDRWITQARTNYEAHILSLQDFKVNLNSDNEFMVVGRYFHAIPTGGLSLKALIQIFEAMIQPEGKREELLDDVLIKTVEEKIEVQEKAKLALLELLKQQEEAEKLRKQQAKEKASKETKPDANIEGDNDTLRLSWPTESETVIGNWNDTRDGGTRQHKGIDLAVAQGSDVYAAADGTVTAAILDPSNRTKGGSTIAISHKKGGISTAYAHLSQILVKKGDKVSRGDIIGKSGGTKGAPGSGYSTDGPHLHFVVKVKGEPVPPLPYLDTNSSTYRNTSSRPTESGIDLGPAQVDIYDAEKAKIAAEEIKRKLNDGWQLDTTKTDETYIVFFKEFGVPFFKDYNISNYTDYSIQGFKLVDSRARIILNNIGISLTNKFVPIPIAGHPMPFYQHLGGCNVSVSVGGLALVDEATGTCTPLSNLQALYNLKEIQFLALRGKIDYTPGSNYDLQGIRILNKPLGLLGLVNFIISDLNVSTVPDTPNAMNVTLNMFENYVYDNTIYNESGNISVFQDYILPDLIADEITKLSLEEAKSYGPETFELWKLLKIWGEFERSNPGFRDINDDEKLRNSIKKTVEGWLNIERLSSALPFGVLSERYERLTEGGKKTHLSAGLPFYITRLMGLGLMTLPGVGILAFPGIVYGEKLLGGAPEEDLKFITAPLEAIYDTYFLPVVKQAKWLEHASTRREYLQKFYSENCNTNRLLAGLKEKILSGQYSHDLKARFNFDFDSLRRTCYPDLLLHRGEDPGTYLDSGLMEDTEQITEVCNVSITVSDAAVQHIKEHFDSLERYRIISITPDKDSKGSSIVRVKETKPLPHGNVDGTPYNAVASQYVNAMAATDLRGAKHLLLDQFTYDASFPTFKIYLIEDGEADESSEFLGMKHREWDKFYSYSAITEIEVARFKHDVDVAVIKFLNTFGNLTTKIYGADLFVMPEFSKDVIEKDFETRYKLQRLDNGTLVQKDQLTGELTPISKMFLQAGTKILIKLGYHNLESKLPTVFTGLVTEVQPGEVVTVVCQGFLSELMASLDGRFPSQFGGVKPKLRELMGLNPDTSGLLEDIATYAGTQLEHMRYYGWRYIPKILDPMLFVKTLVAVHGIFFGEQGPERSSGLIGGGPDPRLRKIHRALNKHNSSTGVVVQKLLEHPSAIHFGGWYLTSFGMYGSAVMFGGFWDVYIGTSNRSIENIDPALLRDGWQRDNNLTMAYPQFPAFYLNDKNKSTVWETIRELGYRHPTHIVTVRPYGTNATLLIKERTDTYTTAGLSFYGNSRTEIVEANVFTKFLNEKYPLKTFREDMKSLYHGGFFGEEKYSGSNFYVVLSKEQKKLIQDYVMYQSETPIDENGKLSQYIYFVSVDEIQSKGLCYFDEKLDSGSFFVKPDDIWTMALKQGKLGLFKFVLPQEKYLQLSDKLQNFILEQAKENPILGQQLSSEGGEEPVTMPHYVNDKMNMIFNNIRTNENIYNAVVVKKDEEDNALETMIALDDNILDSHKKVFNFTSRNVREHAAAWSAWFATEDFSSLRALYGLSILTEKLAQMYKGEIAIVGNPNIKPFDTIVLDDAQTQLYGSFEVASVIHRFTQNEGFITFIEPHLISNISNYALAAAQGRIEDMIREGNKQAKFLKERQSGNHYTSSKEARDFMMKGPNSKGDVLTRSGNIAEQLILKYLIAGGTGGLSGLIAGTETGREFFADDGVKGAEIASYISTYQSAPIGDFWGAMGRAKSLPLFLFSRFFPSWASTLSNYMYQAGPYRQPIVIKPLTLRAVPFIAGIRGAVFNSWFDSATLGLSRAIKELPEELHLLTKGLRSIYRGYSHTIGSKFSFLRFN